MGYSSWNVVWGRVVCDVMSCHVLFPVVPCSLSVWLVAVMSSPNSVEWLPVGYLRWTIPQPLRCLLVSGIC